jgi:hypothetical protein
MIVMIGCLTEPACAVLQTGAFVDGTLVQSLRVFRILHGTG